MKAHGTSPRERTSRAGTIAQAGALISAALASACCWLPLLLLALGVSGGTMAARFEALRPVLLPVTFALLGLAFFFAYRKPKAAPASGGGDSCGCPPEQAKGFTLKRLNRIMLWVVTVFVLAFAFFPHYVGLLWAGNTRAQVPADGERVEWTMTIDGMTCQGCAAHLRSQFLEVPGVVEAEVDYEQGRAVIAATPEVNETALRQAVQAAGYAVSSIANSTKKQGAAP